jgi:plasmid stabilization system protein ParE
MELEIKWTDFSKRELKKIFEYYKKEASVNVARKLVVGITKETLKLKANPRIGQQEELLKNTNKEFRYLVYKSYKIIYLINDVNSIVEIFDVFNTRQNPPKIKRTK